MITIYDKTRGNIVPLKKSGKNNQLAGCRDRHHRSDSIYVYGGIIRNNVYYLNLRFRADAGLLFSRKDLERDKIEEIENSGCRLSHSVISHENS